MLKLTDITSKLREFASAAKDRRAQLEGEREKLAEERAAIMSAPLRIDDAKQFLFDYIDAQAADFPRRAGWPTMINRLLYPRRYDGGTNTRRQERNNTTPPLCLADVETALFNPVDALTKVFGGINTSGLQFMGEVTNLAHDGAACFLFGEVLKARIAEYWDVLAPGYLAADAREIGPPIAKRRERIAKIDARLSEIAEELGRIVADLNELRGSVTPSYPAPPAPPKPVEPAIPTGADAERIDYALAREFNGHNAEALAEKYNVPVHYVGVVAARNTGGIGRNW